MNHLPDFITHYYAQGSQMLKNICSHADDVAEAMLAELKQTGKRVWLHPGYLEERRRVEAWIYGEMIRKGKKPHLKNPLYFILGENDEFFHKGGFFSDANPAKLRVPLSLFTADMISFTYPDSMASLGIATDTTEEGDFFRKPHHGKVFTLDELPDVVEEYGLPGDRWKVDGPWRHDRYIEAQVWDDRPVLEYIGNLSCGN